MSWDNVRNVNIELDARKARRTSILESIHAIDGSVAANIAHRLYRGLAPGELPNYDSSTWSATLKNDIRTIIDDAYSFTNPLNPLKGINPAAVDQTTREIIENEYFSAKSGLLATIGISTNLGEDMRAEQGEGIKKADQLIRETAHTGYNRTLHGWAVEAAMRGRLGLDPAKYDVDVLKRQFSQLAGYEVAGTANKDLVYRLAPR
jgi:hypothetical protein